MNIKFPHIIFIIVLLFCSKKVISQSHFKLINNDENQVVSFKLLSNLIVFPIEVNGTKLNFILDSGVGTTVLFNLSNNDTIQLKNTKKIKLQGLGSEEPVDAISSEGNLFKFKNIVGFNQKLYVIFDDSFNLSSKLGITIHGIIGYELLKNFVVKTNYGTKKMMFYDPETYAHSKCRKCETFDLEFYRYKPYINIGAKLDATSEKITPIKLLIDSGGSDAMWLFENSHPDIKPPEKYFVDFLGEGLSGAVYGKRAFIKSLVLGKHEIKSPTVSYPDSASISFAKRFKQRNGSLGGSILKRFVVTYDYPNNKISLKKGGRFNEPFRYNMSGIELVHNGKILVKEKATTTSLALGENSQTGKNNKITFDYQYKYTFKPSYRIQKINFGSPAYNSGLLINDIVIKINGRFTHEMELDEIVGYFFQKEGTKIKLVIERGGQNYEYEFRLKNMLK